MNISTNKIFINAALESEYEWMDEWLFYVLFNSVSVISGQWVGDNERLFAMESHLRLKESLPQVGFEPGTTRSAGQCLSN